MPNFATVKIDTTRLNQGLALAAQYTRRTPADAVNTAAYYIAVNAQKDMPYVTIPTIDSELGVMVSPKIGVRGKPLKKEKVFSSKAGTATGANKNVALAILIIQARGQFNSNYNKLTNYRYALFGSPFKGVSRSQGQAAMAALVHEMIAKRHQSGHFLQAGWTDPLDILFPLKSTKYVRSTTKRVSGIKTFSENLGQATPAQKGRPVAVCIIENDIGLKGENADSMNKALNEYGAPALQRAIDREGASQMQYYLDKSAAAELYGPVNAAWS